MACAECPDEGICFDIGACHLRRSPALYLSRAERETLTHLLSIVSNLTAYRMTADERELMTKVKP